MLEINSAGDGSYVIHPSSSIPSETVVKWLKTGDPRLATLISLTEPIVDCSSFNISMYIWDCLSGFFALVETKRNLRSAANARSTAAD